MSIVVMVVSLAANPEAVGLITQIVLFLLGLFVLILSFGPQIRAIVRRTKERLTDRFSRINLKRTILRRKKELGILFGALLLLRLVGFAIRSYTGRPRSVSIAQGVTYIRQFKNGCWIHALNVNLNQAEPVIMTPSEGFSNQQSIERIVEENNSSSLKKVVAAVNGDFFDKGGPQGFLSSGGRLTAPNRDRAALEFLESSNRTVAQVCLFRFATDANVTVSQKPFPIRFSYNTEYVPGDIGVYTIDRGGIASGVKRKVLQARVRITDVDERKLHWRGVMTEVVENPSQNLRPMPDEVVLVAANEATVSSNMGVYAWAKQNFKRDAPVSMLLSVSPKPQPLTISGGPEVLRLGQYIVREENNPLLSFQRSARTAVGISEDKHHLLVVAVEGPPKWGNYSPREILSQFLHFHFGKGLRAVGSNLLLFLRACWIHFWVDVVGLGSISSGMTMNELARYFNSEKVAGQKIPSVLNLDGGSSTVLMISGQDGLKLMNTTMEGNDPEIATALGFASR